MILDHGYPATEYIAETSDGFLLVMQRIPYGRGGPGAANRPVILLQHGLLDSSAAWVVNPIKEGLGYILADAGFDVFLGNIRGNTWSSGNTKYSQKQKEYWDLIDFDNMASIDLEAEIEKALEVSNQESLVYVGHSQGTLMGFAGFPLNPELTAKVDLFIALAPVAYVSHQKSELLNILADLDAAVILELFGVEAFLPSTALMEFLDATLCEIAPIACANVIFFLCGHDSKNLNDSRLPEYMDYTPAGTSVRNMMHWSQMVSSGNFAMFDYGTEGNEEHYNSSTPPLYHPENMHSPPVAFFVGSRDSLADPADVRKLLATLPVDNEPLVVNTQPTYEHLDFTWGENAYQLVYPELVQLALKYSKKS